MVFASTLGCSFEAGWGWNCTQYSLEQTIDMGSQRRHQNWEGSVGGIQIHSQSPTSILLATVHPCSRHPWRIPGLCWALGLVRRQCPPFFFCDNYEERFLEILARATEIFFFGFLLFFNLVSSSTLNPETLAKSRSHLIEKEEKRGSCKRARTWQAAICPAQERTSL